MVLRVVLAITEQLGHSLMWRSSLARSSASKFSSRYSLNSLRKSLHVSKGVVSFAFEEARQLLTQLQSGPQQPALDRRNRKTQGLRGLFRGELFDVAQHKNGAVKRLQAPDGGIQEAAQLIARKLLFGIFVPGGDFAHHSILAGVDR